MTIVIVSNIRIYLLLLSVFYAVTTVVDEVTLYKKNLETMSPSEVSMKRGVFLALSMIAFITSGRADNVQRGNSPESGTIVVCGLHKDSHFQSSLGGALKVSVPIWVKFLGQKI